MELGLPRVGGAHGECGGAGSSVAAKERKNLDQIPKEWRSDEEGCTLVSIMNGHGMREPFAKKNKKRKTARVRT